MDTHEPTALTAEELAGEGVTALPDKEVVSILDLAADVDLAIDGAAPVDLAVALNANVVAPIDGAVSANLLSDGSNAQALADQGVQVTQNVAADAVATGVQDSVINQQDTPQGAAAPADGAEEQAVLTAATETGAADAAGTAGSPADGSVVVDSTGAVIGTLDAATGTVVSPDGTVLGTLDPLTGQVLDAGGNLVGTVGQALDDVTDTGGQVDTGDLLEGDLLNVDVNVDLDADLAAPINGAVAANANVAAPIDAAVATNIASENSESTAIAQQDAIINQTITGTAEATSEQQSQIDQSQVAPAETGPTSAGDEAVASDSPTQQ